MNRETTNESGLRLAADAEPAVSPATPFPRFERIEGRLASGADDLGVRESEIPRTDSAAELRVRMTRRTLGR